MQQGILFHTLYAPDSGVYVEQFSCDIQGNFNLAIFKKAWQQLIVKHPILRTSFIWEGIKEPVQVVHKKVELPWQEQDLSELELTAQQEKIKTCLVQERETGFVISQPPLMRLKMIKLGDKNYKFIWTHHHLLLDGWSSSLLLQELFVDYQALTQGENLQLQKTRPYRDYIAWLQKQDLSKAEIFWQQYLKDFTTVTSLGIDNNIGIQNQVSKDYDTQILHLSHQETTALQSLARQQQLTLNTIFQGAWGILLSRYSGENDIVFGGVVSGRPTTLTDVESMVGVFINTLPVRINLNPQELLISWLKQLQNQQNQVSQYEHTPLIEIQKWSEIPVGQPLFTTIFNFQNYPIASLSKSGIDNLTIANIESVIHPHYPLNISIQVDSEISLEIVYNRHRFDKDAIARMLAHLQTLLLGIVTNPQQRLSELSLLTNAERYQLLEEWNNTQFDYPHNQCIHQLFATQVEKTPDAVAVVFKNESLTYRELNQKANQLAQYLQKQGVKPEILVGICVERSLEMIIALLAILKAGGAYVPLDPNFPTERLAFMVEDSQISILITEQNLYQKLPTTSAEIICLDKDWENITTYPKTSLNNHVNSHNLSYIIYTSGSTGKPKGVQITHTSVVNFLTSIQQQLQLTNTDNLLSVTTLSFDIAVLEIFLPLTTGAKLTLVSREIATDGVQLLEKLNNSAVTIMQATPATWRMLLDAGWQGNTQLKILCGGEALAKNLADKLLKKCHQLWNLYGPTETTIWSTIHQLDNRETSISIGRPLANTNTYILDKNLQPVPIGVPGELHIGGAGLARGYLNRPELTIAKFIDNPFKTNALIYKTGDLARYLANGEIEYLGRIDHQIKLRGFRIELGEIEAVLSQHSAVHECVVMAREDVPGNQRLVAYLVPELVAENIVNDELRQYLRQKLPEYMIPSAFVNLESLPLTPNGKINRRALPAPDNTGGELTSDFVLPRHPVEAVLADIWSQILGIAQISIHNNFLELGGHSLLATQVISRIRKTLEVDISLQHLFELPTIAKLATNIQAINNQSVATITPVNRQQKSPLSFAQSRLWLLEQLNPESDIYNMPAAVSMVGNLNVEVLEQSINEIIHRHEVLRTIFTLVDGEVAQVIIPDVQIKIPVVDLRDLPQTEQKNKLEYLSADEFSRPFDFSQAPLLRCKLLRLETQKYLLLFTIHHIVFDGWSQGILIKELAAIYSALSAGETPVLPKLPIQYADFAVWQRQHLQGERRETLLTYWKQQLANLPILQLPTTSPRAEVKTNRGAIYKFLISDVILQQLQQLSQQTGVTLFMTLLASFKILWQRYSHQDDIVVGTDVANRNQSEIEPLIGFFINLLVLRTDLSGNPTFRELLQQVRTQTLAAYAHQDLPFDELVRELQPERHLSNRVPLFQVLFVLQNTPNSALELPGLTLNLQEVESKTARFDLALFLTETEQGIEGKWQYNADLFAVDTITKLTNHWQTLISSIVAQPQNRINSLEMFTAAEKEQQIMQQQERKTAKRKKFMNIAPKAVSLSAEQLVKTDYLTAGEKFPLVIQPNSAEIDIISWSKNNCEYLETELFKHGAILFRGFDVKSVSEFENFAQAICPNLFAEYGDLPRTGEGGKVYGSTPYPADKAILFHNESSHLHCFPLKIWFYCVQPAQEGGETPIVDCRKAYQLLSPELRAKLATKQLMYTRNYAEGLDVSWQNFFQTTDKKEVENYCRQAKIDFEWYDDNGLITRQIRPALAVHPQTKEAVFFNQIQLHHISYLDTDVRESLLSIFGESKLPRNVYFGDGSPITSAEIAEINAVYQQAQTSFPWQKGDIIMLDNMLAAHARNPFVGERKIVVAMAEMINGQI
jgi:amino acid adenylation domain-containing protein